MEQMSRQKKARFEDFRPYELPRSLDALRGRRSGMVTLPVAVFWQTGEKAFDLSKLCDVVTMYEAVVAEATSADQERYLNKGLLIEIWPDLALPIKAARQWEERFPELTGNPRASWKISA